MRIPKSTVPITFRAFPLGAHTRSSKTHLQNATSVLRGDQGSQGSTLLPAGDLLEVLPVPCLSPQAQSPVVGFLVSMFPFPACTEMLS